MGEAVRQMEVIRRKHRKTPEPVTMVIDGVTCLFLDGNPDDQQQADVRDVIDAYQKAVEHGNGYREIRSTLDGRSGRGDVDEPDGDHIHLGPWPGIMLDGKPLDAEIRGKKRPLK